MNGIMSVCNLYDCIIMVLDFTVTFQVLIEHCCDVILYLIQLMYYVVHILISFQLHELKISNLPSFKQTPTIQHTSLKDIKYRASGLL